MLQDGPSWPDRTVTEAELEEISTRLRAQYPEDLVQEMLIKLWHTRTEVKNPYAYAKSCYRTIMAERGRVKKRNREDLDEVLPVQRPAHAENPLARAEAIQAIERCPESLLADQLGIRPLTKIQRYRARRRAR
jgi:DNA-directed RNA polymerase specialized sigma24 family protein